MYVIFMGCSFFIFILMYIGFLFNAFVNKIKKKDHIDKKAKSTNMCIVSDIIINLSAVSSYSVSVRDVHKIFIKKKKYRWPMFVLSFLLNGGLHQIISCLL